MTTATVQSALTDIGLGTFEVTTISVSGPVVDSVEVAAISHIFEEVAADLARKIPGARNGEEYPMSVVVDLTEVPAIHLAGIGLVLGLNRVVSTAGPAAEIKIHATQGQVASLMRLACRVPVETF